MKGTNGEPAGDWLVSSPIVRMDHLEDIETHVLEAKLRDWPTTDGRRPRLEAELARRRQATA